MGFPAVAGAPPPPLPFLPNQIYAYLPGGLEVANTWPLSLGALIATPFFVPSEPLTAAFLDVTIGVQGGVNSKVRLGIYSALKDPAIGDYYPDALMLDAGVVDGRPAGTKTLAIAQTLKPLGTVRRYFLVAGRNDALVVARPEISGSNSKMLNSLLGLEIADAVYGTNLTQSGGFVFYGDSFSGGWTYAGGPLPATFPARASVVTPGGLGAAAIRLHAAP